MLSERTLQDIGARHDAGDGVLLPHDQNRGMLEEVRRDVQRRRDGYDWRRFAHDVLRREMICILAGADDFEDDALRDESCDMLAVEDGHLRDAGLLHALDDVRYALAQCRADDVALHRADDAGRLLFLKQRERFLDALHGRVFRVYLSRLDFRDERLAEPGALRERGLREAETDAGALELREVEHATRSAEFL